MADGGKGQGQAGKCTEEPGDKLASRVFRQLSDPVVEVAKQEIVDGKIKVTDAMAK